jgi:hypothetical protein
MKQADLAHAARREGLVEDARRYFEEAYRLERTGALQLRDRFDAEPSRSILFRSAATLALQAMRFAEAEQLVCMALAGNPPSDIAEELRDTYEQITFSRHLELRGVTLQEREIQMSLVGPGIGYGIAPTDAVFERIEHAQTLMYRFAERKLNRAYRVNGAPPKEIREAISLFMAVPRAASFAVSLRIGGVQAILPGMSIGDDVIDDVVECLGLYEHEEEEALRHRIQDEAYLTNFRALARAIAPDGKEVDAVGFTLMRYGREKTVALKRVRNQQPRPESSDHTIRTSSIESTTITGTLNFADKAVEQGRNIIKLVDEQGNKHSIVVPPGIMDDIVHPLWSYRVTVVGTRGPYGRVILSDIYKAQE